MEKDIHFKDSIEEIRIRLNRPIALKIGQEVMVIEHIINKEEIDEIFEQICENSIYSYKKENAKRDIRVKELFLQLLKGTDAYVACEHRFTYVIISRAYNGNCFTSLEFRKFFYAYRKSILANQKISLREKYIYYLVNDSFKNIECIIE